MKANGGVVWRATALSSLVALPALFARPWADERIYLYWPEQIAGRNPLRLVGRVFYEIPGYLELGVFRWLSRLLTFTVNWLLLRTSLTIGVPVHVLRAVPKVAMIALLGAVAYLTLSQYREAAGERGTNRTALAVLPITMAASLTLLTPSTHPLTLFPTLYLGTAAVALALPLWLGRIHREGVRSPARSHVVFILVGGSLASMIELAYLALPLSILHLLLLNYVGGKPPWSNFRVSAAFKAWLYMAGGLVAVFLPVRWLIARACANGACYEAAVPALAGLFRVFPQRLIAGAFPVLQGQQWEQTRLAFTRDRTAVTVGLVATVAAWWILRRLGKDPEVAPGSRRTALAGICYSTAIIVLAGLLSSLSMAVQQGDLGLRPWRETGFAWVGWSMLLAIISAGLMIRPGRPRRLLIGSVLAAGVFLATVQNQTDLARERSDPEARLHNQVATLLVDFDQTEGGNAQRCEVTGQLLALPEADSSRMPFLVGLLDAVATNRYRARFCQS